MGNLGRRVPDDFDHVAKYPYALLGEPLVATVEKLLGLPGWHPYHDQGREGSCVGHAVAMERAITNRRQLVLAGAASMVRYDPITVWRHAKAIDEWPDTNPDDENGTSVRAAYEIARVEGMCRVKSMRLDGGVPHPIGMTAADLSTGVDAYRWAETVDEIRTAISNGSSVVLGVNWYSGFDSPTPKVNGAKTEWWLPRPPALGTIRGGHAVCCYGASDRLQAVRIKNSWGKLYPPVWMPYATLLRLLVESGEAALVTDR